MAAEHAAREGLAKELAARATESWCREVALLSLRRSRLFCEAFFRELLAAGIAENHPDLAERCLTEALYFVPGPFVEVLQQPRPGKTTARRQHDARVAAVLRLLRDRAGQVPGLEALSRRLAESEDRETRGFATEILARYTEVNGETPEQDVSVEQRSGVTWVAIRPGAFRMGSDQEQTAHAVRISQGFWLGKYPVTNAQYGRFLEAAGKSIQKPEYWDNRRFNQPEQPVVGVSWQEAQSFCEWVGGRLPSEAEWEYACRAGTVTEYSFGDDPGLLGEYGWFDGNSNGQSQPVGAKQPNPWGLYDMHGNVWEWCQDWYGEYSGHEATDPLGPPEGSNRVIRGGGWNGSAVSCRSAVRYGYWPVNRDSSGAFRVARSPSGK